MKHKNILGPSPDPLYEYHTFLLFQAPLHKFIARVVPSPSPMHYTLWSIPLPLHALCKCPYKVV